MKTINCDGCDKHLVQEWENKVTTVSIHVRSGRGEDDDDGSAGITYDLCTSCLGTLKRLSNPKNRKRGMIYGQVEEKDSTNANE